MSRAARVRGAMLAFALPWGAALAADGPPLPHPDAPMEPRQAERSGHAPIGLRVGGLLVNTEAAVARTVRSEQRRGGLQPETTALTEVSADLGVRAGSPGHWLVEADGGLTVVRGGRRGADDRTDAHAGLGLSMPLGRAATLRLEGGYALDHEPRTTPLAEGAAAEPVPVRRAEVAAGLHYSPGTRLSADLRLAATRLDYDDVPRVGGGFLPPVLRTINNDDRDRLHFAAAGRVGWHFTDLASVYLRGSAGRIGYGAARDDYGFARDAETRRWAAGVTAGVPGAWRAYLEAGQISHAAADRRLPAQTALAVAAGATVAVTPLMTGQVRLFTEAGETTEPFASAVLVRGGEMEVEHELLRSVILLSHLRLEVRDYLGPLGRRDLYHEQGAGVRWRIGRVFRLEAAVRREELQAAFASDGYAAAEATVRLAGRF